MVEQFDTAGFWIALAKIIWVNLLLSGDNAVVIALASRNLPARRQQRAAIMIGSGTAILMRVVLTLFAVQMLQFPWLKLVGAVLLVWIGIQLLADEEGAADDVRAYGSMLAAVRTILIADVVMSLDNVIAVAAAAESAPAAVKTLLLGLGLALSIPLIIFGSGLLLKLMDRFPLIVMFGAAVLGFVAGEMAVTDPAISDAFDARYHGFGWAVAVAGAALVIVPGSWLARRRKRLS